ncbi:MAG: SPOR domain-containing protein [Prevotellaceae bacterium]|jgi:hypothetical protein|nr:SPOR domain-containing protein [Prevotellaceae bacterium]
MKRICFLLLSTLCLTTLRATSPAVEELALPDSITGAMIVVFQSDEINKLLFPSHDLNEEHATRGFRIQIFSENQGENSRNKAFKIEKNLLAKLPRMEVYVTYSAPFWKVRIGNYTAYEDADKMREMLIELFPDHKNETYVVPDKIILK